MTPSFDPTDEQRKAYITLFFVILIAVAGAGLIVKHA